MSLVAPNQYQPRLALGGDGLFDTNLSNRPETTTLVDADHFLNEWLGAIKSSFPDQAQRRKRRRTQNPELPPDIAVPSDIAVPPDTLPSDIALPSEVSLPAEIPLEALEGTSSAEQLKQEALSQIGGGSPPGLPAGFDAPITAAPTRTYTTDLPIKAGYRNIYGTDVGATVDINSGAIKGHAHIPIGKAENGHLIGVEGSYTPGQLDSMGIQQPPGFSGMIRYTKRNKIDPKKFAEEGAEKYNIELGIQGNPRLVPPERQIPVQVTPNLPPGLPPGLTPGPRF